MNASKTKSKFQVYNGSTGQLDATITAASKRDAAREYLQSNPSIQSCLVGRPGYSPQQTYTRERLGMTAD
jgi:hypothetical protein